MVQFFIPHSVHLMGGLLRGWEPCDSKK